VGQEPSLITINYGTNEGLNLGRWSESDLRASVTQSLAALRSAAPQAVIFVIVPFGRYVERELRAGIDAYRLNRTDNNFFVVDLGLPVANALATNGFWGGLHPNARGHATIAARIIPDIVSRMPAQ
jgi:lysophospholipase L1-like esterase